LTNEFPKIPLVSVKVTSMPGIVKDGGSDLGSGGAKEPIQERNGSLKKSHGTEDAVVRRPNPKAALVQKERDQ
jgi:hypothetical protein